MISLEPMTRERFHELYRGFQYDPVMFMDPELYERCRSAPYDPARTDAKFDKHAGDPAYLSFAVMLDGRVIGEAVLKHIDREAKSCELGIHLIDDSVKGKGYGTEAERLAIEYAFRELGTETVLADCIIKNTRSQHILDKLGFGSTGEKDGFRLYKLEKDKYKKE